VNHRSASSLDRSPLARTEVTEFSRVTLRSGDTRTIALLSRPGDEACVALACWRADDGAPCGRVLIRPRHRGVVADALRWARDPSAAGRHDAGELGTGGPMRILVWADRPADRPPAVFFGRVRGAIYLGGAIVIAGVELDALEKAIARLAAVGAAS